MEKGPKRRFDSAGLPVIATVARLLCRELTLQNEYLQLENRTLKEKVSGRIRFTDEERRQLMRMAMDRPPVKEVAGIVKPETVLAWQRRLEGRNSDYSARAGAPSPNSNGAWTFPVGHQPTAIPESCRSPRKRVRRRRHARSATHTLVHRGKQ